MGAGGARAIYLEGHKRAPKETPLLVCLLPRNAPPEEEFRISQPGLELRVNRPVRFHPYYSTRGDPSHKAGSLVTWNDRDFQPLPPLQTTARITGPAPKDNRLPITLTARMNELGLLRVTCIRVNPPIPQSWSADFDLRPHRLKRDASDRGNTTAAPILRGYPATLAAA